MSDLGAIKQQLEDMQNYNARELGEIKKDVKDIKKEQEAHMKLIPLHEHQIEKFEEGIDCLKKKLFNHINLESSSEEKKFIWGLKGGLKAVGFILTIVALSCTLGGFILKLIIF